MSQDEPGGRGERTDLERTGGPVDHARIDELLAGHALHALDGDDLREAERLLTEHLPGCDRCRDTVEQFRAITAELALGSRPADPPEMLLPRLRLQTQSVPVDVATATPTRLRRWALGSWLSAAAALLLIGLILWNAFLHVRLGHLGDRQKDITRATNVISQPDTHRVTLESARTTAHVLLGYREAQVALFGSDVEAPARGDVYRLWLGRANHRYVHVGDFVPDEGLVALVFEFDAHEFDQILITEEPESREALEPSGAHKWSALLRQHRPTGSVAQPA